MENLPKSKFFFAHYGLTEPQVERYLEAALSAGGDYADLYFEYLTSTSISLDESLVKSATQGISAGCGVRVISGERTSSPRHHFKGTTTWFRPDLFKGNHEFKFGFDYTDSWFGRPYPALPRDTVEGNNGAYSSALFNYRLRYNNGSPFQLEVYNNPVLSNVIVKYLGLYAQDSWTLGRRVTLNLGLRYAHDNGFVPQSCRTRAPTCCCAPISNPSSPRSRAAGSGTSSA